MDQILFRLGLRPRPSCGKLQSLPRTPGWKGTTSKGWEGSEKERRGLRREGKREGKNVVFHHLLFGNLTNDEDKYKKSVQLKFRYCLRVS